MNWRRTLGLLGGIALAALLPFAVGAYPLQVAVNILFYLSLALSWDMLLRSGQINFGISGFFGVGAYTATLLFLNQGLPRGLTMVLGGLAAAVLAFLLGIAVLELRGMYFAITTLAIAMILPVVARNLPALTGGPGGRMMPQVIFAGNAAYTYWLVLGLTWFSVVLSEVFQQTRVRFALTAIRNNEWVAKSCGINVFHSLLFAFTITSFLQGLVGGVYAHVHGFVAPEGTFHVSFLLLPMAMTLLGGVYTTEGSILGAIILGTLSEYLKLMIPYGHLLVYGAMIVIVTLFAPRGVVGLIRAGWKKVVTAWGRAQVPERTRL